MDCVAVAIVIAKLCVASGLTPLLATKLPAKVPGAIGVPLIAPVKLCRRSPAGNAFAGTPNVGGGTPEAVTVNA